MKIIQMIFSLFKKEDIALNRIDQDIFNESMRKQKFKTAISAYEYAVDYKLNKDM